MEDELRAAPPSYRNTMSTKLRLYRRDLGKLQRDMKTSAPGFGFSRQTEEGSHGIYSSQNQQSVSFNNPKPEKFLESEILNFSLAKFYNFASPVQTHLQSQRALLLQGSESLNNASQSIQRSQQIANETEQIGNDIIEELGEQREQLDRTRNRVRISFM